MSACPLVVLACESLHVCTVCVWRCEHARFCVEGFYALYINFHSFIHSYLNRNCNFQFREAIQNVTWSIPYSVTMLR